MTYEEACKKDPGIKELHERYLVLMDEANKFANRSFELWLQRYFSPSEEAKEVSDYES